jgi:hypothetical protein
MNGANVSLPQAFEFHFRADEAKRIPGLFAWRQNTSTEPAL